MQPTTATLYVIRLTTHHDGLGVYVGSEPGRVVLDALHAAQFATAADADLHMEAVGHLYPDRTAEVVPHHPYEARP